MNTAQCKRCEKVLVRERGARRANNPSAFYYVNHQNRIWNGRTCPDCSIKNAYEYKQGVRVPDKTKRAAKAPTSVVKGMCRKCNQKLPPDRYFRHEYCVSAGHNSEGFYTAEDWGYGLAAGVRL